MPQTDVQPGEKIRTWKANTTYNLLPTNGHATHLPIIVPGGLEDVTILAVEGPDRTVLDAGRSEFGVRGNDGVNGIAVLGPTIRNAGHGIRITHADEVRVEDVVGDGCGVEAVHLSFCLRARVKRLLGRRLGAWQFTDYPPDRSHALYLAGICDDSTVEDLHGEDCGGSCFQGNAASTRDVSRRVTVTRMVATRCGKGGGGTYAISLMSAREFTFADFQVTDCPGIAMLHSDGRGPAFACYDNHFTGYSVTGSTKVGQQDGSSRNVFDPAAGYSGRLALPGSNGVRPLPPPPPVDATGDLQSRLADALRQLAEMTAARDQALARIERVREVVG